jgi:hypothetical protein
MIQRLPTSPGNPGRSSQKMKFFQKPRIIGLCRGYSESFREQAGVAGRSVPDALRGELVLRKKLRGMPRTASGMPDERNANTDAERGQIQYDHNKRKQIHSHRQSDCGVHCQNANQPKESGLLDPNENWVTQLDQAD